MSGFSHPRCPPAVPIGSLTFHAASMSASVRRGRLVEARFNRWDNLLAGAAWLGGLWGDELLLRFTKFAANFLAGICTLTDVVVGIVEGEGKVTILLFGIVLIFVFFPAASIASICISVNIAWLIVLGNGAIVCRFRVRCVVYRTCAVCLNTYFTYSTWPTLYL